jgi:putative iron-regulated protein
LSARRGQYLQLATQLLVLQLNQVAQAWAPNTAGNYRARFARMAAPAALSLVIKGMGSLSGPELGGERLRVAYETKDQEHEHSCFSDNTHADVVGNVLGMHNVCRGRYARSNGAAVTGVGMCELFVQAGSGARLAQQIDASLAAARAIPPPFDRAVIGPDTAPGRVAIARTMRALQAQTETLAELAANLRVGLTAQSER